MKYCSAMNWIRGGTLMVLLFEIEVAGFLVSKNV